MKTEVDNRKDEIRRAIRRKRAGLSRDWVAASSLQVQNAVCGLNVFHDAAGVGCYLACPAEVQTDLLVSRCREDGKALCVPAWADDMHSYFFARVDNGDSLAEGPCGILQPSNPVPWDNGLDIILVPGLAFDASLNRLGHGGGHYDRLLSASAAAGACKVGLAFDFQLIASVPVCGEDVQMDIVVTESRIIGRSGTMAATGRLPESRSNCGMVRTPRQRKPGQSPEGEKTCR